MGRGNVPQPRVTGARTFPRFVLPACWRPVRGLALVPPARELTEAVCVAPPAPCCGSESFGRILFTFYPGDVLLSRNQSHPKELIMQPARVLPASVVALGGLTIVLALAGCGKNPAQTGTLGAPAVTTAVAAETNSFAEVTSHLDAGG